MSGLHTDLAQRVVLDTHELAWQPSPSPSVWRKRLYHDGAPEAGRVTSLVRFGPSSRFHAHAHPEGEEIFVLEGTFSDERGDFGPGTYMLNPEGFSHAPFSIEGCLLFVRLRQYGGPDRESVLVQTAQQTWRPRHIAGVSSLPLYRSDRFPEAVHLTRLAPGTRTPVIELPRGEEIFVVAGSLEDEEGRYGAGTWLRLPPGSRHTPHSESGCTLYVRTG